EIHHRIRRHDCRSANFRQGSGLVTPDPAPYWWLSIRLFFTASGLQSRPNHQDDVPSGLPPKLRLVLAGLPNCPAPRHNRFRSIANSRSSTHTPVRVPLSGFQREPVAEVSSPVPRELAPWLSLPAWS